MEGQYRDILDMQLRCGGETLDMYIEIQWRDGGNSIDEMGISS